MEEGKNFWQVEDINKYTTVRPPTTEDTTTAAPTTTKAPKSTKRPVYRFDIRFDDAEEHM